MLASATMDFDPNWRERYAAKLTTPEDAVRVVRRRRPRRHRHALPDAAGALPGARGARGRAAGRRDRELDLDVHLVVAGRRARRRRTASMCGRSSCRRATGRRCGKGLLDYVIAPPTRSDESYWLDRTPDVFLMSISPPDDDGWCSFGMSVWGAPEVAREAAHVIGEVNDAASSARAATTGSTCRAFEALVEAPRGVEVPAAAAAHGRGERVRGR